VTLHQVLDPRFSTRQGSGRTREIRARFGEGFIIGHFGRVVESCYPHSFLHILPELRRRFPRLRVVFAGGKIDHPDIVHACFRYDEMPEALSACDLVLYNYRDHQGHFAGSMKVLEAMACGVPVLSPRYDARVEELGSDYELFHDYEPNHGRFPERVEKEMLEKMSWAIEDQGLRERVSQRLAARARHYAVSASAERLQATLRTVMESAGARPFPAPSRLTKASYLVTAPVVEAGRALRRMWRQAVKPR
jgi:glycosyltransferase involved in cell wall biosynthesis